MLLLKNPRNASTSLEGRCWAKKQNCSDLGAAAYKSEEEIADVIGK
jgi:hypothetical protein